MAEISGWLRLREVRLAPKPQGAFDCLSIQPATAAGPTGAAAGLDQW